MYLERLRIVQYGPFEHIDVEFIDGTGGVRLMTVIHGKGGTGKSTLVETIAHTRPGKAVPLPPHRRRDPDTAHAICDWRLGLEDPERPHPLRVISPNARRPDADAHSELVRKREQVHFDRCAAKGPGFAFVDISSQRFFSRASVGLSDPARMLARYDPRSASSGLDASRPDLTRPCKQALSYAAISAALCHQNREVWSRTDTLGEAMADAVNDVVGLAGFQYLGPDPHTLEPVFETAGSARVPFDGLPTQLRHAIAFVAIPIRVAWAGHDGVDPRITECVVAIDDFELYLGPRVLGGLFSVMRRAMPRAQWLLTTSSPHAAAVADADSLITLRRQPDGDGVDVYRGHQALTH